MWSLDNQNRGAFLHIFSASDFSSGRISFFRNSTIGSIQLEPTLTLWIRTMPFATSFALSRCSTRITRGRLPAEEVASVANESTWLFPLLETCNKLKRLKSDYTRLTWLKYSCILTLPGPLPISSSRISLLLFLPFSAPWPFPVTMPHTRFHYSWPRIQVSRISL